MRVFFGISSRLFLRLHMASGRPVTNLVGCALVRKELNHQTSNMSDGSVSVLFYYPVIRLHTLMQITWYAQTSFNMHLRKPLKFQRSGLFRFAQSYPGNANALSK